MKTEQFNYKLPNGLIAQKPLPVRHNSRLLVYNRENERITHSIFYDIQRYLHHGDLLIVNKTKVMPARIFGKKSTGGKVEVLLLNKKDDLIWEVLVGGKRMMIAREIFFPNGLKATITETLIGSKREIKFNRPVEPNLGAIGNVPLPPYIHEKLSDPDRYQTVYAKITGSAAAPTAGLHFTNELISEIKNKGVGFEEITLHVGLDTFAPVTEENIEDHHIHSEWCEISEHIANNINSAIDNGGRIIAVGTTSVRTLENAAKDGHIESFSGFTRLFIYPGYQFKIINGMITNFHLPKSSLLMLVSAFTGYDQIIACYQEAIKEKYRFYSFGDAMLIF